MRELTIKVCGFALAVVLMTGASMSIIAAVWVILRFFSWLGSPL